MVDFSFVIVTYNSHTIIGDAIKSILHFEDTSEAFEIIIVDNSSVQLHNVLIKEIEHLQLNNKVFIIHNPANSGYGAGNNIGINAARGKFVAIMNPDVRLMEPVLSTTKTFFLEDSNLSMLAYKQLGGINFSFYRKPEYSFLFAGFYMKIKNKYQIFNQEKDFLSGAFFFIDKDKFIEVGLFDENIFMYNEESDISTRINQKKYNIKFHPSISYLHLLDDRLFSANSYKVEMKSLSYYLEKFQLQTKKIIQRNLLELDLKIRIASLMNMKNYKEKFSEMRAIIKQQFSSN